MLEKYFYEILFSLIFVISLCSTCIFFLLKLQKEQRAKENEALQKAKEKESYILDSLDIITKALLQEQCEISEGCIRIRMLLISSKMIDHLKEDYRVFEQMYQELKDLKTHKDRASLSSRERMQEDKKRFSVESEYQKSFLVSTEILAKEVKALL